MKKIIISIIGAMVINAAFAAGENIATSKAFVDAGVAQKQEKIPANNGTAQVLTNTGTPGETGTKDIYDSTGTYSEQTDALVTAGQFNTAVQNAIDNEFTCIQYNPNDPTDCWLVQMRAIVEQSMLSSGYTPLEYIESTGTQLIDTNVTQSDHAIIDMFPMSPGTDIVAFMYAPLNVTDFRNGFGLYYDTIAGLNDNGFTPIYANLRQTYDIKYDSSSLTIKTNNTNAQTSSYYIAQDSHIALFGAYDSTDRNRKIRGKLYSVQIYNKNSIVRDFIPARRDSDGEIGMYDTVSDTFFTNSGTGEFIAGPAIGPYMPSGN